jgi:hypothetical protein
MKLNKDHELCDGVNKVTKKQFFVDPDPHVFALI